LVKLVQRFYVLINFVSNKHYLEAIGSITEKFIFQIIKSFQNTKKHFLYSINIYITTRVVVVFFQVYFVFVFDVPLEVLVASSDKPLN